MDPAWSSLDRSSQGIHMDVDEPAQVSSTATQALASATLANSSASADPLSSRYDSNSKDAYRERKRQKEIEQARLDKIKRQEEANRIRTEVEAERLRRAGGSTKPHATDPALEKMAANTERQRKLEEVAERQRVLKEIEEDRIRKFGADAAKPTATPAEQKAAYEEKQKEKSKEEWKVSYDQDQKRLAELRKQLAEEKEKRAAEREAQAAARQASTSQSARSALPASAVAAPRPAPSEPVDPTAPKRSVAEEMAEARRARLGITKVTGTQAHAGRARFIQDNDDDDIHLTIDQIKARNKARAEAKEAEAKAAAAAAAPPVPEEPAAEEPISAGNALREMHAKRHEEQRRRELEEAERKARADRAARMLANTTSLATSSAASPSPPPANPTSDPNAVFFQPSSPAPSILGDIPLETSASDIPEDLVLISLRLPDGRIKKAGFKARDPLVAVHRYAASWLPRDTIFNLIVPMPRQEFNDEQMESTTLREAGLAPRGTLTVMTLESRGTVRQAPPRPENLHHIMGMMRYQGNEMEAAEEFANLSYEELMALQERMGYVPTGLTDREIKVLPTEKYVPTDDGAFCVICQGDIEANETVVSLPKCAHKFHRDCVYRWLKENRSCPACRSRIFDRTMPINPNQENDAEEAEEGREMMDQDSSHSEDD